MNFAKRVCIRYPYPPALVPAMYGFGKVPRPMIEMIDAGSTAYPAPDTLQSCTSQGCFEIGVSVATTTPAPSFRS